MLFDFEFWNPCWRQMTETSDSIFSRWLRELTRKSIQQIVNLWLASNQLVLHVPTVSDHSARVRLENKINKLRVHSNKTSASVSHSPFHLISDFGKLSTSIKKQNQLLCGHSSNLSELNTSESGILIRIKWKFVFNVSDPVDCKKAKLRPLYIICWLVCVNNKFAHHSGHVPAPTFSVIKEAGLISSLKRALRCQPMGWELSHHTTNVPASWFHCIIRWLSLVGSDVIEVVCCPLLLLFQVSTFKYGVETFLFGKNPFTGGHGVTTTTTTRSLPEDKQSQLHIKWILLRHTRPSRV